MLRRNKKLFAAILGCVLVGTASYYQEVEAQTLSRNLLKDSSFESGSIQQAGWKTIQGTAGVGKSTPEIDDAEWKKDEKIATNLIVNLPSKTLEQGDKTHIPLPIQSRVIKVGSKGMLEDPSFEAGGKAWKMGMSVSRVVENNHGIAANGKKQVLIEPSPNEELIHEISQELTTKETGYYTLNADMKVLDNQYKTGNKTAKIGVRTQEGVKIVEKEIEADTNTRTITLDNILLEEGTAIEVYIQGSRGETYVDKVIFELTEEISAIQSNITNFKVDGQVGKSIIDPISKTIHFTMPYGSKQNSLRPQIEVSKGAELLDENHVVDFTKDVTYKVKGETLETWIIKCEEAEKSIVVDSSNSIIRDTFNNAVPKALDYVMTNKPGWINRDEAGTKASYIEKFEPSYWAGYAHRWAYYGRDFAHQATGAHLLGLEEENFHMLKRFAETSTEEHKWYPVWALNFDGSTFKLDYRNKDSFVREVPAVFELVEKAYEQYLWTGNEAYLEDEALWVFYEKAMTDFIKLHDTVLPNGIAEGSGKGIFGGSTTYNERGDHTILEAGDGIASQYQGTLAYAGLLEAKGEIEKAKKYYDLAEEIKTYFNREWGVNEEYDEYIRGYKEDHMYTGFGREQSWFMPLKEITEPGEKTDLFLDYIDEEVKREFINEDGTLKLNIEALSYLPDMYFIQGDYERAWEWMAYNISRLDDRHEVFKQGNNWDYPEIPYTIISQTVEGLMGVVPNAPANKVTTLSKLPKDIEWLTVDNIKVGKNEIKVYHKEDIQSQFTNHGEETINWVAQFNGEHEKLVVGDKAYVAKQTTINGKIISYVEVKVKPGDTVVVSVE